MPPWCGISGAISSSPASRSSQHGCDVHRQLHRRQIIEDDRPACRLRQGLQQRQRARRRDGAGAGLPVRLGQRVGWRRRDGATPIRASEPRCARGVEAPARSPRPRGGDRALGVQRLGIRACRRRPAAPQCARPRTWVSASSRPAPKLPHRRRTAPGRGHGAGGDAPVAGRGVVHRVVEAGRRDLAVVGRQRLAERVAIVAVAAGRGEHRGQLPGIALPAWPRRLPGPPPARLDREAGAAPLGRRQRLRRGHRERCATAYAGCAGQDGAARRASPSRPGPSRPMPSR